MKIKKFGKQVDFRFVDEKTGLSYVIKNLNCTEEEFLDWVADEFNYDHLETTYGVHDYSGSEDDNHIIVGFTSYEISKKDFITVMEIWRKGLLDAGFITENDKVQVIGEESNPVIVITNPMMDYTENFEIKKLTSSEFKDDYLDDFSTFVEDELCEDESLGIYEFDGEVGNDEYLIQTNDEEDNWEKTFQKVVKKIKNYFKKIGLDLTKISEDNSNMTNVDLTGREFVFTGFRDAELKNFIESCGGVVKDGITKNTTDLLTKNEDSTSSKAKKAKEIGAKVTQVDVFKDSLK